MTWCRRYLLPLLAFVAMAGAQVFGLQQGYVCEHEGVAVITHSEHCHKPADETTCHTADHCEHHESDHSDEGRPHQHHSPATLKLLASSSLGAHHIVISAPLFPVTGMFADTWSAIPVRCMVTLNGDYPEVRDKSPPASLQVVRCIVRQV